MYSMQPYFDPTNRMRFMENISLNHHHNYWRERKYTKLRQF
jgi:hypothetical protein